MEVDMKRTTVFVDDEVIGALQTIARRRGVPLAEITREALGAYVSRRQRRRKSLTLAGIGSSGRDDVAERAEELLKEGFGH
jgi:predicted transcriptional regulator